MSDTAGHTLGLACQIIGIDASTMTVRPDHNEVIGAAALRLRASGLTVSPTGVIALTMPVTLGALTLLGAIEIPAASSIALTGRSMFRAPAVGQFTLSNYVETAGIGLDVATDGTLKIRNRAQNADANLSAAAATFSGVLLAADGTSGAPSYSFTSEPTLGFWRSGAARVTLQGANGLLMTRLSVTGTDSNFGASGSYLRVVANGQWTFSDQTLTNGALLKVDALPTIASGFGTSPAITAGSTPFAGSVDVGTGGVATTGTITFGGAAFPSAPFCVVSSKNGFVPVRATATTTQLTITASAAWAANEVVSWVCVSSK